jgi:hypothetical protein
MSPVRRAGRAVLTEAEEVRELKEITEQYLGLLKAEFEGTHVADQEPVDGGRGSQVEGDVGSGLLGKRDRE